FPVLTPLVISANFFILHPDVGRSHQEHFKEPQYLPLEIFYLMKEVFIQIFCFAWIH
ncbi:hypothetical protein HispidOSU_010493, partial [Sigmodon hispidus]